MSLISFIKEAGPETLGHKEVEQTAAKADSGDAAAKAKVEELNGKAGEAIVAYIHAQNLDAESLAVAFDGATGTVSVSAPRHTRPPARRSCCAAGTSPAS